MIRDLLDESATSGAWSYGELYAAGRHVATYSGGTTNFLHTDWLGTKRVTTSVSGANSETCTNLPFGDANNCTGTNWSYNNFTDFPQDFESNTEHAWFRQYNSTQGRWLTPDPAGLAAVDPTNPQSWNRYAYVTGNPTNGVDPLGLFCVPGHCPGDTPTTPPREQSRGKFIIYYLKNCFDFPGSPSHCQDQLVRVLPFVDPGRPILRRQPSTAEGATTMPGHKISAYHPPQPTAKVAAVVPPKAPGFATWLFYAGLCTVSLGGLIRVNQLPQTFGRLRFMKRQELALSTR